MSIESDPRLASLSKLAHSDVLLLDFQTFTKFVATEHQPIVS